VYNGGFEEFDTCPTNTSTEFDIQIEFALGWYSPSLGTPDYFNACSIDNPNQYTSVGVPSNFIGTQVPNSGNAYGGFYGYVDWINGKEYLQTKLVNSLEKGKIYEVGFFVSLSDSSEYALNEIGVHLSPNQITRNDFSPFDLIPQIKSNIGFITDTSKWLKISCYFLAEGGEKYMTIGNFQDSSIIFLMDINNSTSTTGKGTSYYYIDDVYIRESQIEIDFPNVFTPNNDEINDHYVPILVSITNWSCYIVNRWGNSIVKLDQTNPYWDGKVNGVDCSEGVYYYSFEAPEIGLKKTGFFSLIR
jgi:OOP family OmpA-OmpF porin